MKKSLFVFIVLLSCLFIMTPPCYASDLLEELPTMKNYTAQRISSYDRKGGNKDFLSDTTGTATLAEIEGSGAITHIWVTINSGEEYHLRKLVLRIYWDGEENPSVESPIGDFFGIGHGTYYHFHSKPISIGTARGMNCFWFMPFEKSAKITLTNEGEKPINSFYYYIDYRLYDKDDKGTTDKIRDMGKFHAKYNQQMPTIKGKDYLILSAAGKGHYVGCNLSIELNSKGWWGEGDDKIYIDDDTSPTMNGTGSEDYFCGAWGYGDSFYSLYFGCPLRGKSLPGALWNVYRYHIEDPIPFTKSIKVMIEAIHQDRPENPPDNYSSVAYWYQIEPHTEFAQLPPANERLPKPKKAALSLKLTDVVEAENLPVLSYSENDKYTIQDMSGFAGLWSNEKQLWFIGDDIGDYFVVEANIKEKGEYIVDGYFTKSYDYCMFDVYIDKKKLNNITIDGFSDSTAHSGKITLGTVKLSEGSHKIKFVVEGKNPKSKGYLIGVDCFKFNRVERETEPEVIIIDDLDVATDFYIEGKWNRGEGGQDYAGDVTWAVKGNGESKAFWRPRLPKSGRYSVYIWYGADPVNDHATNAPFIVKYKGGEETFAINLKKNYGKWNYIGEFKFKKGSSGYVMTSNDANGNVLADAVKFVYKKNKKQ